jgi:NADPH-dependent 7-cyano-7-deazaguanine reductase QueF
MLYIASMEMSGLSWVFHEFVTNKILTDLVAACQPRRMEIEGDFNVRGGIQTIVRAVYEQPPCRVSG